MDYLIRFVQAHESFRQPEIEALAALANAEVETVFYSEQSPFCVVRFHAPSDKVEDLVKRFISRSVLSKGIYELWGFGDSYEGLHESVRRTSFPHWPMYKSSSFRFSVDAFCGKRSSAEQSGIINTFAYLGFEGPISLRDPDVEFTVFEEWDHTSSTNPHQQPVRSDNPNGGTQPAPHRLKRLFLGRKTGSSSRHLIDKHDLKKRPYISTTSMDAELALVTANLALASPGRLFLDPFVGTGGFLVAAAEFGALVLGSDIDGRSFRGNGEGVEKGIGANFSKYGLQALFGDCIISDLTNTPLRDLGLQTKFNGSSPDGAALSTKNRGWLDGIVCDPPYGVREGLKVLGTRKPIDSPDIPPNAYLIDGIPAYKLEGYVAPKKPYSFIRMLDDILDFAARTLVDSGRLAFWMPTANDEEEIGIPEHPALELVHSCIQPFNKWSRRLLVYRRKDGDEWHRVGKETKMERLGNSADELNPFRRKYFQGFEAQ